MLRERAFQIPVQFSIQFSQWHKVSPSLNPDRAVPRPVEVDFRVPPHGRTANRGASLIRNSTPPPGPPQDPRHSPDVGSQGGAISYERGTPVHHPQIQHAPRCLSRIRSALRQGNVRRQQTDSRTTILQKCAAVPRRPCISGSWTFVSLNSRLESNEGEKITDVWTLGHLPLPQLTWTSH